MKIKYNAPITLNFAFIATIVLLLNSSVLPGLTEGLFVVPGQGGFAITNPLSYLRLFTHVIGHANWSHLLGNFTFILLLGPGLEEKYGSTDLMVMILITAFITGALNSILFPTGLLGASGVVFMMILLSSFTNIRSGEIPLTFILIFLLFLLKEVINAFQTNDISEFAHIGGGIIGSLFGFFNPSKEKSNS
ncbi:rhomboid family intramembrane serine protease [Spirochaeta cellobiosiphila]|uniref:rhomboid family intramembrane serine protease n=1 Tax=Spirochaeta cellobiosiphila TaxID=504483 RepID=UPI00040EB69D|nr:rhomboid family intramembrane serine protease [Spirochaeta cellobiosiphila]